MFAGVGGFRIGLNNADSNFFETKWSNQYEPSRKRQDAFDVYNYHFPQSENINIDITKISDEKIKKMDADMIVGGFPCQDYSVARSLTNELGIKGKKGVLFWEIIRVAKLQKPKYMILENVDRLLKAPTKQRGRDFAIILTALNNLNYSVEWRVINASEYGGKQRRRRVYLFVFRNDLPYAQKIDKKYETNNHNVLTYKEYILKESLFAKQFPIKTIFYKNRKTHYKIFKKIVETQNYFSGKFWNAGIMRHGHIYTYETISNSKLSSIPLKDTLQNEHEIEEKYFVADKKKINRFKYLRSSKRLQRTSVNGYKYIYTEGGMTPYEDINLPSRTILTTEGRVNRCTHLLKINGKYRTLTPIEAERLQDFPDDWTKFKITNKKIKVVSDCMRMFFMGNALVTNIIKKIGLGIKEIEEENNGTTNNQ